MILTKTTVPPDPGKDSQCPIDHFGEPRSEMGFDPRFYPRARCVSAPELQATERSERIEREFCAVYYRLNRLHARLIQARRRPEARPLEDREILLEIEKHLRRRDELEDRYAPYGVIAEAVSHDGFTVEIKFTFGDRNVLRLQGTRLISSSALVFLRVPKTRHSSGKPSDEKANPTQ